MPKAYAFEPLEAGYAAALKRALPRTERAAEIDRAARRIVASRARYEAVEARTGVPWAFIGVLHYRESSNDFRGVLHNGEKIIGTGRRTRLVPAGRGPFTSWEEAAVDALNIKNLSAVPDWSLERVCYEAERFNGFGYRMRGRPSPYLWGGTNIYLRGKYVADGVWDANHVDTQLGVIPIYLRALDLASLGEGKKVAGIPPTLVPKVKKTLQLIGGTFGSLFTLESSGLVKGWSETLGVPGLTLLAVFGVAAILWSALTILEQEPPADAGNPKPDA